MMLAGLQLILTAFVANLVSTTSNQSLSMPVSNNFDAREIEDPGFSRVYSDISQSFQNLINSVARSDTKRNRDILVRNVANGQQAFDAMKGELQAMRSRKVERKRNRVKGKTDNLRKISPVKRQAEIDDIKRAATPSRVPTSGPPSEDDDQFIATYGTDRMYAGRWDLLRQFEQGDEGLMVLAKEAHLKAGMGDVIIADAVKEERWLDFYDPKKYTAVMIDVLVYCVEGLVKNDTRIPYYFYITKGLRPDCVYYLGKEVLVASRLTLGRHVCGIVLPTS